MDTVTINDVLNYIDQANGKWFSVKFIKRSTNTLRQMTCRTGVKIGLANNPDRPGVDFKSNRLIPVWVKDEGRKSIPVEGIVEFMIKGVWYKVINNEKSNDRHAVST